MPEETKTTISSVDNKDSKGGGTKSSSKKSSSKKESRPSPSKFVKKYTFDQWASRRDIPKHHRGGMKAYMKDSYRMRTLEEWDSALVGY